MTLISHAKDRDGWNTLKKSLDGQPKPQALYFNPREVWYCSIGHNIGHEEDGKNGEYSRPVVIIKWCGPNLFIGIPLSSKIKTVKYYFSMGVVNGREATAMISQMRMFSTKRLINKVDTISQPVFDALKKATKEFIFSDPSL